MHGGSGRRRLPLITESIWSDGMVSGSEVGCSRVLEARTGWSPDLQLMGSLESPAASTYFTSGG